jgi:hypothetical protein
MMILLVRDSVLESSPNRLVPVLTLGGENPGENGQNLKKAAGKQRESHRGLFTEV